MSSASYYSVVPLGDRVVRVDEHGLLQEQPICVDLAGAAQLLSVSPSFLAHSADRLGIPSIKLGRRRLFPVDKLKQWVSVQAELRDG